MSRKFQFEVRTEWHIGSHQNTKTHSSKIEGKQELIISAAREFKGDPSKYNPEDLLLSALSSCHMMSYFYVCQQHDIEILAYQDQAVGTLELNADSSGKFSKVVLTPVVKLKDVSQESLAISLHEKAHQLCFIANSVNFEVQIKPSIVSG